MRKKKHQDVVKDYDRIKSEHLDKLATKMLANDEKMSQLKQRKLTQDF